MKLRIAIWSGVGAIVVVFWTHYISATSPTPLGIVWTLAYLTCPNHAATLQTPLDFKLTHSPRGQAKILSSGSSYHA